MPELRDKAELLSIIVISFVSDRLLLPSEPSNAIDLKIPVWQATARRQAIRTWEDRDQRMLREKERAEANKSVVAELTRYGEIGSF